MTERLSASFHNMPAARLPLAAPVEEVVGGGGAGWREGSLSWPGRIRKP